MQWVTAVSGEGRFKEVLNLVLLLIVSTLVLGGGLLLIIFKYYWGPTGKPPEYRNYSKNVPDKPTSKGSARL